MPAINTRPTKRAKTSPRYHLPDEVFRNVVSYIIDPYYADKQVHKERFVPVMFQLTVLPLYLPITPHYDDDVRGDDSKMVLQHHASKAIEWEGWDFRQFDIRTQTTWETRDTLEWIRGYEEEEGQFYEDPKYLQGIVWNNINA